MTVPAADVAAALRDRLPGVPTKKLHKLLYYCQGHHLAATGSPLFSETISAWDMGPVVGSLWYAERDIGPSGRIDALNEATLNTVGYVVSRYGRLTGRDLENLTHAESPWIRADRLRQPSGRARIEIDWMLAHFAADADEDDGDGTGLVLDSGTIAAWLAGAETRRQDDLRSDSYEELRSRLSDAS